MVGGLVAPSVELEEEALASTSQGVIFVLENAKLETAKVGKVSSRVELQVTHVKLGMTAAGGDFRVILC